MKLTAAQLRRIIKEETQRVLEGDASNLHDQTPANIHDQTSKELAPQAVEALDGALAKLDFVLAAFRKEVDDQIVHTDESAPDEEATYNEVEGISQRISAEVNKLDALVKARAFG